MPHSTRPASATRIPNSKMSNDTRPHLHIPMEKFPDHVDSLSPFPVSPVRLNANSGPPADRWQTRRESASRGSPWNGQVSTGGKGHGRQKSLTDAFRTIRGRRGSISQNAHELGDALKAPVSPKLVVSTPSTQMKIELCTETST